MSKQSFLVFVIIKLRFDLHIDVIFNKSIHASVQSQFNFRVVGNIGTPSKLRIQVVGGRM
ncbi:hypothetical protein Hanom_Chr04g00338071 [Helianthus anomalus]